MSQDYKDRLAESVAKFVRAFAEYIPEWFPCESPIEHLMAGALKFSRDLLNVRFQIETQKEIGEYRVDFLVTLKDKDRNVSVIVECDGHEFHEKTKEQASRDKHRDRELQKAGFNVLHFSGSEIWRRPMHCAFEVIRFLEGVSR